MFEPPGLHNVAQESVCLKITHFPIENTEIVGFLLRQKKKKMEIHWFPEDPPKKGCWFEMVFLIRDSNIQN